MAPSRVIHVLLAQTEQRLVATLDRYGEDLAAVRAELAAVLAMLDRSAFTYLCCTPEVPPAAQAQALMSGERRFAHWRRAVTRMLTASGRSVPWPLPDSEQAAQPVSPMPPTGDTTEDLKAADRPGRIESKAQESVKTLLPDHQARFGRDPWRPAGPPDAPRPQTS